MQSPQSTQRYRARAAREAGLADEKSRRDHKLWPRMFVLRRLFRQRDGRLRRPLVARSVFFVPFVAFVFFVVKFLALRALRSLRST